MRTNLQLVLCMSFFVIACNEDDKPSTGDYATGVFVVNEGAFGSGNGTITHYNSIDGTVRQNIFLNTAGSFAGDVVQSLNFSGNRAFIVVNGDSKIEVADGNMFTPQFTITDVRLDKPRYIEIVDGNAYISVWGAYDENFSLVDSYVLVYDLTARQVVKKIDTDEGTENLLYDGTYLYASNFNFGASNTVSVINPATNELVEEIELSDGPSGMVLDSNGKLWVICVGGWGATSGSLFRINTSNFQIEEEITISGAPGADIGVSPDGNKIIYSVSNSIFELPVTATREAASPVFEAEEVVYLYSLQVDAQSGTIWVGDAPSFSAPGKVYVYSSDGDPVTSFEAGIAPTQVVFK